MSILIKTLLDRIITEFSLPEPKWEAIIINEDDFNFLNEECNIESDFDPLNLRKIMFNKMINGDTCISMNKCEYGQVFVIFENLAQKCDLPWGLWGRILRLFTENNKKPFKIFFLASKQLREFPPDTQQIKPEHINGGYTYRCNPETIVIYRAEDATRVLIHELQHSCCLDKVKMGVDIIEAETEAWAELFYIAILSQGKKYIFNDLLQRQSEWIRKQNSIVKTHMKNIDSMEFPWRYTVGKEEIWNRWGILRQDDTRPIIHVRNSLRLTYPANNILKERYKVPVKSTII